MSTHREERHEQEMAVHAHRSEPGLQALRSWLYDERDAIGSKWVTMTGDDLMREQGRAMVVNKLIRMIDSGPTIRGEPT